MALDSQKALAASTAVASIASAALLTLIGLCVPYTERGAGRQGQAGVEPAAGFAARLNAGQQHSRDRNAPGSARTPVNTNDGGSQR